MSENIHYKAIQSLISELVAAIQDYHDLQALLGKAWNKKIIEESSFDALAIHKRSNNSREEIAKGLVSAVATSVSKKPEIFYQFVTLLKDTKHKSLADIAFSLEKALDSVVDMSTPSEASNSPSLSERQPKPKPARKVSDSSSTSARRLSDSAQSYDDGALKQELFDHPTFESGFQDVSENADPIAGEQVGNGATGTDHVLYQPTSYVKTFSSVSGGDKATLVPKDSASESDPSKESIRPTNASPNASAESEATGPISENHELVLTRTQQSAGAGDATERHVAAIIQDNKRKISRIESLENELLAYASREQKLQQKLNEMAENVSKLEHELAEERENTEKNKQQYQDIIDGLKNQIREKEDEVEVVKKQLAEAEKIGEKNKELLLAQIESLRVERDQLEKEKSKYWEQCQQRREKLNELQEKYNQKVAEENKTKMELTQLQKEVLQLRLDYLEATTVSKKEHESIVQQHIEDKQQLEKDHDASLNSLREKDEQAQRRIEELEKQVEERDNSIAQLSEKQSFGRSTSATESNTSDKPPAVESQVSESSQTESGRPSRSSTDPSLNQDDPPNNQSINGTTQSEDQCVPFVIGSTTNLNGLEEDNTNQ